MTNQEFKTVVEFLKNNTAEFKKLKSFVLSKVSVLDILQERSVEMDGNVSNTNLAVKCPFHETDSFDAARVHTKAGVGQLFFCNNPTCPVYGKPLDAIALHRQFLEKEKGIQFSYYYALLDLYCNKLGKEMPKVAQPEKSPKEIEEEKDEYYTHLLFLHITAIARKLLFDPKLGEVGRKYLASRKISEQFIKAYHIGFIPTGYKLSEDLLSKGFNKEFLAEKGIISKTTGNDTLFNRIVIPMWNEYTDILSPDFVFKNAIIDNLYTRTVIIKNEKDKAYKHRYINRELPFFNIKSALGKQSIILVEGIIDCLSVQDVILKMRGLANSGKEYNINPLDIGVAATYGTNGLSETTMQKYLGGFKNIYLAADNDMNNAGQSANIKRGNILKKMFPNANVKLVTWSKKDANDMLVSGAKPEEFWACLDNAVSLEEFCVENIAQKLKKNKDSIEITFKVLEEIKPIIEEFDVSDTLKAYKFADFISKRVDIPLEIVLFAMLKEKIDNPLEIIKNLK